VTLGILVWVVIRFGRQMWAAGDSPDTGGAHPRWTRNLLVGWTAILATLALLPVNSHPWYWTWPIVPIAVLVTFDASVRSENSAAGPAPVSRWFWGYLILTAFMTIAYHTRIVHV